MKGFFFAILATVVLCLSVGADTQLTLTGEARAAAPEEATPGGSEETTKPVESHRAVVGDYCRMCHNDTALAGNMSLVSFDVAHPEQSAELAEKMIRKLRAGMMPPSYAPKPEPEALEGLARWLETRIDAAWAENPNPGGRVFQRLNRAEYARSIRGILALDVDVAAFLPPDTVSHGFDNVADVQAMSPTLMQGYLRAASEIARLAVGEPGATPREAIYKVPRTANQMRHVEGAPIGTRGGIAVVHNFPADGEYRFRMLFHGTPTGQLFGSSERGEQIEISVNGERVALLDIDPLMDESDPNGLNLETDPIHLKAGPQQVSAAFIQRFVGPVDDLMAPIEHTLADTQIGMEHGITTLPHLREFSIKGPFHVTGVSDTPSRREIFTCRPISAEDELPCAREIISNLATEAYRRPVSEMDLEGLMSFYQAGRKEGDFETGIRTALQAILASPHFVFRLEEPAVTADASDVFPVSDLDLASRLSYFLWATGPDDALLELAGRGELADTEVLETQVHRMLEDPRSEALATRFAAQWLRLQDLNKIHPDALLYPNFDHTLAEAMRRETELLFDYIIHEDRSVLELLTADYTFVNERLATHYGIPGITGSEFQRVELEDEARRGILGHGSILTLTSIADRTSPVQRGKWVMEVLLGSPPPPPPPNVPDLEATQEAAGGKVLSVREQMELHRANPACNSCHRVIDPLGLALENYDVTGAWRIKDNGVPVDPTGELYDGTPIDGPEGLRRALLTYSDAFLTSFTESLMTYALGRRVEYYDMPAVRKIIREAERNDYRMSSFILGIVESRAFRMKQVETTAATED